VTLATERDNLPLYVLDTPPAALASALASSPISAVATWRSPVLLVHGDEIHGFLRQASWLRVYSAAADFLDAKLDRPSAR
jgi:dipeptidyl aminopeptidase/acylaminoacyl peptidase